MEYSKLIETATKALNNSYSPYSHFKVGAALLCENGNIYTGCNIENASFSATLCAERTAFAKALSNGEKKFAAIAVIGGKKGEINNFCTPCGICLQFMTEFCEKDFNIITFNGKTIKTATLSSLLPESFGRESLC